MSDLKLYRMTGNAVCELSGGAMALEKSLQTMFENNLETLLGIRFLASEFATNEGGRMDTLGIDENNSPVVIEYKRSSNENVINQGLYYLDWLMGHRKDFEWLVLERLGGEAAKAVDWSGPRLMPAFISSKPTGHSTFNGTNNRCEVSRVGLAGMREMAGKSRGR